MTTASLLWNGNYQSVALTLIEQAKHSIALRMFLVETRFKRDRADVASLVHALARAADRGVSVRVLLTANKNLGVRVANVASAGLLAAVGVDVRLELSNDHGKYLLVDDALSVLGSHNWTSAAFASNFECSIALQSSGVLQTLDDEFDKRWTHADAQLVTRVFPELTEVVHKTTIQLALDEAKAKPAASPQLPGFVAVSNTQLLLDGTYTEELLESLGSAKRSIDIMMFRFSAAIGRKDVTDTILGALTSAQKRGVAVRVLLDQDASDDRLLSDVVNKAAVEALRAAGVDVRRDSDQRLMHAKLVVIDDGLVLVGSHNWTRNSLLKDGEISLRILSPAVGGSVKSRFAREWSTSTS